MMMIRPQLNNHRLRSNSDCSSMISSASRSSYTESVRSGRSTSKRNSSQLIVNGLSNAIVSATAVVPGCADTQKQKKKNVVVIESNLISELMKTLTRYPYKQKYAGNPPPDKPTKPAVECPAASSAVRAFETKLSSLTEQNAAYFDHLQGTCACVRCKCGKHKCAKPTTLVEPTRIITNSVYGEAFQTRNLSKSLVVVKAECPPDNLKTKAENKFENRTTNRDDFPRQMRSHSISVVNPNASLISVVKENIKIPFMPSEISTAYKDVYGSGPKVAGPMMQFIPTNSLGVVRNAPFIGRSEMKSQFSRPVSAGVRDPPIIPMSAGVNLGVDASTKGVPNFYQSTYSSLFSPMKTSTNAEKSLQEKLRTMKESSIQKKKTVDNLAFVPTSTHRDHFRTKKHEPADCPMTEATTTTENLKSGATTAEDRKRNHKSKGTHRNHRKVSQINPSILQEK